MPSKLPSKILKSNGKPGEDPSTHIMTYHLWFSSNSLMDHSVRLCLFRRSTTKSVVEWYIKLQGASFKSFNDLEMVFMMHYQLPIRCEIGTELLTSLCQDTATPISDHIHEWRRICKMIKTQILDKLLMEWFIKIHPYNHCQGCSYGQGSY